MGVSELVVIRSGVDTSTGGYQYTIIFLEETEAVPQMLVGFGDCLRLVVFATWEHSSRVSMVMVVNRCPNVEGTGQMGFSVASLWW